MKPTREEVIRVARECGAFLELSTTPEKDMAFLMRFAERFYKAGLAENRRFSSAYVGGYKAGASRRGRR